MQKKQLQALTLEQKCALLSGATTFGTRALPKNNIPSITLSDGPNGVRKQAGAADHLGLNPSVPATCFPTSATVANSWDPELGEAVGAAMGEEAAAQGVSVLLGPGLNIKRSPLCGRNFEYFSEDPYLSGEMGAALVKGIQSNGVGSCIKHFAANNQETRRLTISSDLSERALHEIYLPAFEEAVKAAQPKTVMCSYNKINGVWSHYNYQLCTALLREEWGYTGNVMTDWWMRYAASPEFPELRDNGYRVRAQVDVLMPGAKTAISKSAPNDGSLLATLGKPDGITLGELQRTAKNVLRMTLRTKFAGQYKD